MISNPYSFSVRYWLYELYDHYPVTISNKERFITHEYKSEPEYMAGNGWYRGYSFKHFWSNCYFLLDEISALEGIQQLCHHYYLQNGSLGSVKTVDRIKKLLSTIDS